MPVNIEERFSRWLAIGVLSLLGIGLLAVAILHTSLGAPWAGVLRAVTLLVTIQLVLYVAMYWVRKRFKQTHDLRTGIMVFGLYCLLFGLAGMHYAGQLGLMNSKVGRGDYVGFSIFVLVVTTLTFVLFSFWRPE
jgi:hypothetical protein